MYIYLILLFFILWLSYVQQYMNKYPKNCYAIKDYTKSRAHQKDIQWFTLLIVLIMILISAYRAHGVGDDLGNYKNNFISSAQNGFSKVFDGFEPLYQLLVVIISFLFPSHLGFSILLLTVSCIFAYAMYKYINRFSSSIGISYFLVVAFGIYAQSFNLLRQILAFSVILLSIKFIVDRKFKKFLLYVIIAGLFHFTAFVFLPIYFLYNIKLNYKYFLSISALSIIGILLFKPAVYIFSEITGKNYFDMYYTTGLFTTSTSLMQWGWSIGMFVIFIFLYFWNKYYAKDNSKLFNFTMHLFFLNCLIRVVAIPLNMHALLGRFTMYFFFSLIVLVPWFVNTIKNKEYKTYLNIIVIIIAILYFLILVGEVDSNIVSNYKFVDFKNFNLDEYIAIKRSWL